MVKNLLHLLRMSATEMHVPHALPEDDEDWEDGLCAMVRATAEIPEAELEFELEVWY